MKPPPVFAYSAGDRVLVKIGERPLIPFTVLEPVRREKTAYRLDWAEHGYSSLLNDVPVAETAIVQRCAQLT